MQSLARGVGLYARELVTLGERMEGGTKGQMCAKDTCYLNSSVFQVSK